MRSIFDLVYRMKSVAGSSVKVMEEALEKMSDPKMMEKRNKFSGLAIPDDTDRAKDLLDGAGDIAVANETNEFEEEQEVDLCYILEYRGGSYKKHFLTTIFGSVSYRGPHRFFLQKSLIYRGNF